MFVLYLLPIRSHTAEIIIDPALLSILVFPIIYYLVFKPLSLEINARRLAEAVLCEREERFRAVSETASDAIICLNEHGIIYFYNKSAEGIFGYTADEVMNKAVHEVLCPERFREKAGEGLKGFYESGRGPLVGKTIEIEGLRRDGTEFPIELSISAMNIQGKWHATGIIRDITERKKAENLLRERMDELERFVKATVQREFRMKELMDENEGLKLKIKEFEKG